MLTDGCRQGLFGLKTSSDCTCRQSTHHDTGLNSVNERLS
jgi:hypothetical protein